METQSVRSKFVVAAFVNTDAVESQSVRSDRENLSMCGGIVEGAVAKMSPPRQLRESYVKGPVNVLMTKAIVADSSEP